MQNSKRSFLSAKKKKDISGTKHAGGGSLAIRRCWLKQRAAKRFSRRSYLNSGSNVRAADKCVVKISLQV